MIVQNWVMLHIWNNFPSSAIVRNYNRVTNRGFTKLLSEVTSSSGSWKKTFEMCLLFFWKDHAAMAYRKRPQSSASPTKKHNLWTKGSVCQNIITFWFHRFPVNAFMSLPWYDASSFVWNNADNILTSCDHKDIRSKSYHGESNCIEKVFLLLFGDFIFLPVDGFGSAN